MSMRTHAEQYLTLRRALGHKMRGYDRMLLDFADRADRAGQRRITASAALQWASEPEAASPGYRRVRLSVVRGFARHLHTLDPASEVPPTDLIVAPLHRKPPYLYSSAEIAALVHAAGTLSAPLPAASMHALVSLIAASGLRLGEALGLDREHVVWQDAVLRVSGKNDDVRLVPLHDTTAAMLAGYAARRDRLCPNTASPAFFVTGTGRRMQQRWVQQTFAKLLAMAEIQAPPGRRRPRIHDLRHTFAVSTLINWHRAGANVQAQLPVLSTFLGHTSPEATYWYLQAVPELLGLAAARLDPSGHHDYPPVSGCEQPGRRP
jgi:integrase/recombinase XerD